MKTSPRVLLLAIGASAQVALSASAASAEPTFGDRETFWQAEAGVRSMYITNPGYDPVSTDNSLVQFSLGASRTLWDEGQLSFAPGIVWDYGESSATARGQTTGLEAHRLALTLEGRYHFLPWMYGLIRVAPGALHQRIEVEDPMAVAPYVARKWAFAFDAAAGVAFLLGPQAELARSPVRWWLAAEGGYSYAGSGSLKMSPDVEADDPRRTGTMDLGALALRGGFFRVYAAVTY
jgi:hypothetical protein